MARERWGVWGGEDELGAGNLITAEKIAAAAGLVAEGRIIDLGRPLSPDLPVPGHRSGIAHFMGRDGGDYAAGARRPDGFQFSEDTIILPTHAGTHIDALCHVWYEDELYNGFPGDSIRSTSGAKYCGADKLPAIFSRGVLLDVAALRQDRLKNGSSIGKPMLERALARAEAEIEPGDVVVIRTGWLEHYGRGKDVDFSTEPGIDVGAGRWLAEAGAAMIGCDNFAIEAMPFPDGQVFPVHKLLLRDYGVPLMEGLDLAELSAALAKTFLFVAAPLTIVGGTASPVRPIAVL